MKRKQKKCKDWRELFDLSLWPPLSWVVVDVVDNPFIVVPAKVASNGWRGWRWRWRWRTGGGGWDCLSFFFLIYFRKLSKKRLKIIFEFNMCTCDKFLLVEYRVEQEKWDSKFGLQFLWEERVCIYGTLRIFNNFPFI